MVLTVPVERISDEARQVDVRKGLLALVRLLATILVGIPYVLGWSLGKLCLGAAWSLNTVWHGLTMLWAAAVTGWRDARRPRPEGGTHE